MAANNPKKHIHLAGYFENPVYTYPGGNGGGIDVKEQNRNIQGNRILNLLQQVRNEFALSSQVELPVGIVRDDAIYVEFTSEWGYPLKLDSLDQDKGSFQLLNIREETRNEGADTLSRSHVTLMMREGGISTFIKKVNEYLTKNISKKDKITKEKIDTGNPSNYSLINNIQNIQIATLQSFWVDAPEIPFPNETDLVWWEVWFRKTKNDESSIYKVLENLSAVQVEIGTSELVFAEHRVRLVRGTARQLSQSLLLLDNLAELRKPQETADFLLHKEDNYSEQKEFLEDLVARTENLSDKDSVIISIMDSGVNNKHPLLSPFLSDDRLYAFNFDWGVYDSCSRGGHGTGVATLALYGDLVDAMAHGHQIKILHSLESFKIFQENHRNDPSFYGVIMEDAVSIPTIDRPDNLRVYCMTVTHKDFAFKGRPSTWSAVIDKITFGNLLNPVTPQLFILIGGNIFISKCEDYPAKNYVESVHDPGQSYNALTVGAYTRKDRVSEETGFTPLAANGAMSPSNSTSTLWDHQWPIKPDIVMEGGNSCVDGVDTAQHHSLKLLTADKDYPNYCFLPFGDTSGAAALAAKMAAEIRTSYPDYWPETIRALMVHSADWTDAMLEYKPYDNFKELDWRNLLRSVGYGVPIQEKAMYSANNSLTLIVEREIQPYVKGTSNIKYNEYHLFKLPWPKNKLQAELYDQNVKLTLTLSYYIEPNPGSRNKRYATNFQYYSHGLDFAVIKPGEKQSVFQRRISKAIEIPDDEKNGKGESWTIGRARARGSIQKDFITMSGADMAERNIIAVYPKSGWYKNRKKLGKAESKVRYSLIVSIETPNNNVDIYTPVLNQIEVSTKVPTEITSI